MLSEKEFVAIEMVKCEEALYEKFETVGAKVEGVLVSIGKGSITDKVTKRAKDIIRYQVSRPGTGQLVTFIGTAQLADMLTPADKGRAVIVVFTGKRSTNNGEMKLFDVFKSKGKAPIEDNGFDQITDDDIPF
ncbi:MAG: hypothetical protein P4K78_10690 [Terracidiphilus sp.]|nr:hypothetical protein [Terracidiphilus sp.]